MFIFFAKTTLGNDNALPDSGAEKGENQFLCS